MAFEKDVNRLIVSRAKYMLKDGQAIKVGYPCADNGTVETSPVRVGIAKPYDDTDSKTPCIGVALKDIGAKPTDSTLQKITTDWRDRSLPLLIAGEMRMINCFSGTTGDPLSAGTIVAPYPSGFTKYVGGGDMVKLGILLERTPFLKPGLVFVNLAG